MRWAPLGPSPAAASMASASVWQWSMRPDLHLSLAANDLLGRLHWQDVPEMVQDFNGTAWPLQYNQPQATARITGTEVVFETGRIARQAPLARLLMREAAETGERAKPFSGGTRPRAPDRRPPWRPVPRHGRARGRDSCASPAL